MEWFKDYWWIILILLAGIFISAIKDLNKTSFKAYLKKKDHKAINNNDLPNPNKNDDKS
ncbi:hypothetical protein DKK76_03655 [Frischella perrara]|jgi:hypothetical protein|nr:hypothetical protein DKK76_03655 [Frischella perrara]